MKNPSQNHSKQGFRFNWGTGIVLSFVFFCSFVIYIVVRSFQQNIDLVSDTYYKDELAFQDRIDERQNLVNSGEQVTIEQTKEQVVIRFPQAFVSAAGKIHFYHPSRKIFDKQFDIDLDEDLQQVISKEELVKGNYKVKVSWAAGATDYYQELSIFLK